MRQVPRYLIIGRGRLARHLLHYFQLKNSPCEQWHRGDTSLQEKLAASSHVLLCINDGAIDAFASEHLSSKHIAIHFSGSLVTENAFGAHPLMTFSEHLYDLPLYESIPFVLDDDAPSFVQLFPMFHNPHHRLAKNKKARYHAMCVLAGNFSCLLWGKLFNTFENELNLPKETAFPYFSRQMQNIKEHGSAALTGPLARRDEATIVKNIEALACDEYQDVYRAFVHAYEEKI